MNDKIFNRFERKYILTHKQKTDFVIFLNEYLVDDPYSINGSHYTVYNLYYDTPDFSVIRNSTQKPIYKDKLRLRSYMTPLKKDDEVFLEIKKKHKGLINKRRVSLTYQDALDFIDKGIKPIFKSYIDQQIINEIEYFIKIHQVKPGAYIRYDRIGLMSLDNQLRVTFDHNIFFRDKEITLDKTDGVSILSDQDTWLMEVKSDQNFPFWLSRKLSEFELYSQSFSKYGKAYQKFLIGGATDDYILYHY